MERIQLTQIACHRCPAVPGIFYEKSPGICDVQSARLHCHSNFPHFHPASALVVPSAQHFRRSLPLPSCTSASVAPFRFRSPLPLPSVTHQEVSHLEVRYCEVTVTPRFSLPPLASRSQWPNPARISALHCSHCDLSSLCTLRVRPRVF